ncbi:carbohydrate sulfotransferase 11-like isoform X2 [Homarus americanus]|uniref:carbohydrate sulfotransferase 11-like isoform X2 n=1 Tax=Homarus americanus TaxID=6706 RepID=UPI001C46C869|nr:carbohydrate sulfotransferase 11-like isoform X2 [Homarus americanus]
MRLRVRLKSLALLALLSLCIVIYNFIGVHIGSWSDDGNKPSSRVARITANDLFAIGHHLESPSIASSGLAFRPKTYNVVVNGANTQGHAPANIDAPCDSVCQFRRLKQRSEMEVKENHVNQTKRTRQINNARDFYTSKRTIVYSPLQKSNSTSVKYSNNWKECDRTCRIANLKGHKLHKGAGYASRVQVESMTLPDSWTVTQELVDRLSARRNHVREVCKKYGLDEPSETYQPNAWEFLINEKYGLIWCNIFKAASSTWFYNFNLLAGFSETELLHAKDTPIQLARKRYARDKILSGNRYYSKLSRNIIKQYPKMKPDKNSDPRKFQGSAHVPSFPQFIQFLLDENARGEKLDEHWIPMNQFCTPCLVPFDVYAKVETLEEDGNYIIFSAGIEDVIKPKRINRSRNEPTEEVADKFLCQLSQQQMEELLQLYKFDIELFEYDVSKYRDCTNSPELSKQKL